METPRSGFDLTVAVRAICRDMADRLPDLAHIRVEQVAIGVCRTRNGAMHGVYATLTPLRFAGGALEGRIHGRRWRLDPLPARDGVAYLYLLNFYVPRFLNLSLEEKLSTIVHELWHISPAFDGDLRRHAGRCYAHGGSQRHYDAAMDRLAQRWLSRDPPHQLYDFLAANFDELLAEHGGIAGQRWRTPKLVEARTESRLQR